MAALSRTVRTIATVAVAAGVALGATACSVSVSKSDLETNVASTLAQQIPGLGPVTCPGDLAGQVGATVTCETTTSGGCPSTAYARTAVRIWPMIVAAPALCPCTSPMTRATLPSTETSTGVLFD